MYVIVLSLTDLDIDECFEAALEGTNLCESDPNSECVNNEGSFMCVCVLGYFLNENQTCESKYCSSLNQMHTALSELHSNLKLICAYRNNQ